MAEDDPTLTKRGSAFVATRWNATGGAILQVSRFTFSAIIAAILAPEVLGVVAMVHVVAGFLRLVVDLGTGQAVIRHERMSRDLLSSVFFLNLGTGVISGLGLYFGAGLISRLYASPDLAEVLPALTVIVLAGACANAPRGLLSRNMQFGRIVSSEVTGSIVYGAVAVPLALAGWDVWAVVTGLIASQITITGMIWAFSNWKPRWHMSRADLSQISSFSANLTASNFVSYLLKNVDSVVISRGLGESAMGYYYIAQRLIVIPRSLLSSQFTTVLVPALSRVRSEVGRLRRDYLRACTGFALVSFPALAGIGIVAEPFVLGILGEDKLPAATVTVLFAVIAVMLTPEATANSLFMVMGRSDLQFRWGLVHNGSIALSFIVGARWGLEGLVIAYGIVSLLLMYPSMFLSLRLIGMRAPDVFWAIRPYAVAVGLMVTVTLAARFAMEGLGFSHTLVLVLTSLVGATVYSGYILITKPPALEDLKRLLSRRRPVAGSS